MGDPFLFAAALGIHIRASKDVPFRVGSGTDFVLYRPDPATPVCVERIWEGIAQCLLTRINVPWTEDSARRFAYDLRLLSGLSEKTSALA